MSPARGGGGNELEDGAATMELTDERRKGVAICERCREVYSVWIRSDGRVYPISSHNNCSCNGRNLRVIGDV